MHELIRAEAATAERDRALTAAVVAALVEAGATRMLAPASLGGGEMDLPSWLVAVEDLARADGSTGWTAMTTSATSALAWYLPPDGAAEVFGSPTSVVAGTAAPLGRGSSVEGGYRVTGRWGWGSAVPLCTWVAGGAVTPDGPRFVLFPRSAVTVHDTWDAAGLRATASHEWEVSEEFVPARRAVWPAAAVVDAPMARFPFIAFLALGVAAVGLGIAARAVEEAAALAVVKTPQYTSSVLASQASAQIDLASAEARLSAARAFLHTETAARWAAAVSGAPTSDLDRARLRLACSHAAAEAASVTRLAFDLGGGSGVFADSPLQRCLRDAHVAAQHGLVSRRLFETYGAVRLGVATDTSRL
ncbi:acyl-CoA dehydrogenase family protein [Saccharothrix variisporea]|uniref:Alkylation response protein AidB-like acyl-CoA dehydrogenase n=1 Tax=Saccharothrix variisporea TaxID=543527 RepID=A0A495XKI5_9PSEU|nr:acyl-CoA dehydrogenase family protein [Saccharothrix variisporea]RKT73705.1 alkylation response protein AidB-like acyl-CoA dehydrogenase [Saccharothrix variisporea]